MTTLRQHARRLRNEATDAERLLWQALRRREIEGFRFRRQVPLAGYIVDFLCPQAKLVVEVDGDQHASAIEYDEARTARLVDAGYCVLRYANRDVLSRLCDVLDDIHRHLTRDFTPPQPSPSPPAKGRE
ncbi:MAG: endonuclease domain-containing protein [Lysobacteraceae bacterium]